MFKLIHKKILQFYANIIFLSGSISSYSVNIPNRSQCALIRTCALVIKSSTCALVIKSSTCALKLLSTSALIKSSTCALIKSSTCALKLLSQVHVHLSY